MRRTIIAAVALVASTFAVQSADLSRSMLADVGARRPAGCPAKWCACYLDLKLASVGKPRLGSYRARDFASYGRSSRPAPGAIMVMKSHVGVVVGACSDGRIRLVSGNHSRRVGVGCYSARRAIAWRM